MEDIRIKGDYNDLKSIISQYKKILVTGPHGAGNKITAKVIANDFNIKEIRGEYAWGLDEYYDEDGLITFHRDNKDSDFVAFGPSQSGHLHRIVDELEDVLVVFMYKDLNTIERYTERNPFVREQSHRYEWGLYRQVVMEDFPESANYLRKSMEQLTYHIWENHQRSIIPNWVEIRHQSLEGHPLWIGKEERKNFKEWQTSF
jgi:hypothetical protein